MSKFNGLVVVTATPFNKDGKPRLDKQGKPAVMLQIVGGTGPNRNVLSGTVAESAGFEAGNTYLAQCREENFNEEINPNTGEAYGRTFTWINTGKMNAVEIVQTVATVGNAQVFDAGGQDEGETATANVAGVEEEATA